MSHYRKCVYCRYMERAIDVPPCRDCQAFDRWEPNGEPWVGDDQIDPWAVEVEVIIDGQPVPA